MSKASTNTNARADVGTSTEPAATEHLAGKAHDPIDRVAESSAEAETKLREQAGAAADRIRDTEERAKAAAERSAESMTGYMRENPLMSAGIAFAAGMLLSGMLRR